MKISFYHLLHVAYMAAFILMIVAQIQERWDVAITGVYVASIAYTMIRTHKPEAPSNEGG